MVFWQKQLLPWHIFVKAVEK